MHNMIDIESLSLEPNAVILSIGCVKFDLLRKDPILDKFHIGLELESQVSKGRHLSAGTIEFWLKQANSAECLPSQKAEVSLALQELSSFITSTEISAVWAKGVKFDIAALESLYKDFDLKEPWTYRHVSCMRGILNLKPELEKEYKEMKNNNCLHNALEDAIDQVHLLKYVLQPTRKRPKKK